MKREDYCNCLECLLHDYKSPHGCGFNSKDSSKNNLMSALEAVAEYHCGNPDIIERFSSQKEIDEAVEKRSNGLHGEI